MLQGLAQFPAGDAALVLENVGQIALTDDLSPEATGSRSEVDDRVRATHRVVIMLDDQE